jgi:tetratricopeptide (TPR) repeat protein
MKRMKMELGIAMVLGILLVGGTVALAQAPTAQQPSTPAQTDKDKPAAAPNTTLTLDAAPPPVSAEEDAAMKTFRDAPITDVAKKNQLGEDFVQKYPQSRYRVEVYSWLVKGYLGVGQVDKMEAAGDKELAIEPNDATTLAIVGSTLPRAMSSSLSDSAKLQRLEKAEQFSKKALDLIPALPKPANLTDEQFVAAKNQTTAMAYSGLGLVAFRRGKFTDAITDLEQSVKLDPNPDSVNYLILGISNEKASHFEDAVTAFTKCASLPGGMQDRCKAGAEEAKKLASTQLSTPK